MGSKALDVERSPLKSVVYRKPLGPVFVPQKREHLVAFMKTEVTDLNYRESTASHDSIPGYSGPTRFKAQTSYSLSERQNGSGELGFFVFKSVFFFLFNLYFGSMTIESKNDLQNGVEQPLDAITSNLVV